MEVDINWDPLLLLAICANLLFSPNSFSGVGKAEVATCSEVIYIHLSALTGLVLCLVVCVRDRRNMFNFSFQHENLHLFLESLLSDGDWGKHFT